jgi:hypothetical protein
VDNQPPNFDHLPKLPPLTGAKKFDHDVDDSIFKRQIQTPNGQN